MQRVLDLIDSRIASLNETAKKYETQPGPQAPAIAAVHHFAAATLGDLRKQIVEVGVTQ